MTPLEFLSSRQSCAKLTEPGPSSNEIEQLLDVAMRAPDHGCIKPWQFVVMTGKGRERLGEIFANAVTNNGGDEAKIAKARLMPLRAPCVIAVICKYNEHQKVPWVEQVQSAGCSLFSMQQTALAMGYGGIWRTGDLARDELVRDAFSLAAEDELVGYLYLGSAAIESVTPKPTCHNLYVDYWQ